MPVKKKTAGRPAQRAQKSTATIVTKKRTKKTAAKASKPAAKRSAPKPASPKSPKAVATTPKPSARTSPKTAASTATKSAIKPAIKTSARTKTKTAPKKTLKKASAPAKAVGKAAVKTTGKAPLKTSSKTSPKTSAKRGGKTVAAPAAPAAPAVARFVVEAGEASRRIDRFLGEKLEQASRTRVQKWMSEGAVLVNGEAVRKSRVLEPGDEITVAMPAEKPAGRVEPENIPLEVVYEDKYLVVVNKPKGLVTHPGHGVHGGTLANALAYHYKQLSNFGGADRPGIVHRLDRDTSGLLVAARDNTTHAALSAMLAERTIHRTYQALVWREPPPSGRFDAPLGRHPKDPVKRAVIVPSHRELPGKPAVTHYRVLDWYQFAAHVEVTLETGRTHQIRVHFSHGGFPVAGDTLYGGGEPMLGRVPPLFQPSAAGLLKRLSSQALHAVRLSFTHPRTKKKLSFESPLPQEFRDALAHLQKFKRAPEDMEEEFAERE